MSEISSQLALWIEQLRAIALTGLAFEPHTYDRERYQALLELAARMAASLNDRMELDANLADALAACWRSEIVNGVRGYVTPKVGAGAIVFNDNDEILLIKRPEGGWLFPTGWGDIGYTPAEVAAKEVREETGLAVTPLRIIGVYDSRAWRPASNPHFFSIVFYCRLDGGELVPHPVETLGTGFFARNALPEPLFRSSTDWVNQAWRPHQDPTTPPYFDPVTK